MEIILLDDVEALGEAGDIITVKPGYARNFLFPRGLAVRSSKRNRALSDEKKRVSELRKQREVDGHLHLAEQVKKTEITIEVQVGEEEKVFGSVTTLDIHKAVTDKGINLEKSDIILEEPIKALGIYHVPVKITKDLESEIKLYVIKS
jgi:large subunit ribosomal protein L9